MTDLVVSLKLIANAAGFDGTVRHSSDELKKFKATATTTADGTQELSKSFGNAESAIRGFGGFLGGSVLIASVSRFARAIFDAGREGERIRKVLEQVTGSAAAARQEFAFVGGVAQRLGTDLAVSADAYAGLAAAARGTALEGNSTREIFEAVSEASARLGLSASDTSGVLLALQQIMSKGTVQAEELRGQLGERLPGAFATAARALGVTTQQLGKMLESGTLLADDFLPKFAAELKRTFNGQEIKSATASVNRLSNSWEGLKRNLADAGGTAASTAAIDDLTKKVDLLSTGVERAGRDGGSSWAEGFILAVSARFPFIGNTIARALRVETDKALGIALDDGSFAAKEAARAESVKATSEALDKGSRPAQAYLDLLAKTAGVSEDYQRTLAVLYAEYQRGGLGVDEYRAKVERLIITETDAGKRAAAAIKERIEGYDRLKDALQGAIDKTREEAQAAREQASTFRSLAGSTREQTQSKLFELSLKGKTPEEQAAAIGNESDKAAAEADSALSRGILARIEGRAKDMEKFLTQAASLAQKAQDLGERAGSSRQVEDAGALLEKAQEQQALGQEAKAKQLDEQAASQVDKLNEIEQTINRLKTEAAGIGIELKGSQEALTQAAAIEAAIKAIPDKKVVQVEFATKGGQQNGDVPGQTSADGTYILADLPQRAAGGPVAANQSVIVGERGVEIFKPSVPGNIIPNLVSRQILSNAGSGAQTTVKMDFGEYGAYEMRAQARVADDLVATVQRVRLQRGRRR